MQIKSRGAPPEYIVNTYGSRRMFCPGHAGMKRNDRPDRLEESNPQVLRSLRHYATCGHKTKDLIIIIIIMYIYHALINTLSEYMMHSNLNTILYTQAEHLPKQFT